MSVAKVSIFCILFLTVASASLSAIRATNWNKVGIYAVNKTSGVVEQTSKCCYSKIFIGYLSKNIFKLGTWYFELLDEHPMLAQSPYSSSLIYFELQQQELSAAVIDTTTGEVLNSGPLYLQMAPYSCGGATYASENGKLGTLSLLVTMI